MVGKNDIIGDLEKLNDIITDIIFIIGRKMISFFSSNLAGHTTAHRSPPSDKLQRKRAKSSGRQRFILRDNFATMRAPGAEPAAGSSQAAPLGGRPAAWLGKRLGDKCDAYSSYLRDPQLSGSRTAAHLCGCRKATYEVHIATWNSSNPLRENNRVWRPRMYAPVKHASSGTADAPGTFKTSSNMRLAVWAWTPSGKRPGYLTAKDARILMHD
jgi:hypothetical protein